MQRYQTVDLKNLPKERKTILFEELVKPKEVPYARDTKTNEVRRRFEEVRPADKKVITLWRKKTPIGLASFEKHVGYAGANMGGIYTRGTGKEKITYARKLIFSAARAAERKGWDYLRFYPQNLDTTTKAAIEGLSKRGVLEKHPIMANSWSIKKSVRSARPHRK